jgi:hypothetical protein
MSTMKIAKEWFKANPKNIVTFHHRKDALSSSSREILFDTPRDAMVTGHRVIFAPFQSELNLGSMEWETMGNTLVGTNAGYVIVKYQPVAQ